MNSSSNVSSSSSSSSTDDQLQFTEEDVDAFRHRQMANCALSLLANAYGIFLIRCHSTKEMAIYRWHLLNIVVWAFLMDLFLSLIFQPFLLLPIFGYCVLGFPSWFSSNIVVGGYVPFLIFLWVAASCLFSLCLAFGYRLMALFGPYNSQIVHALRSYRTKVLIGVCILLSYIVLTGICVLLFSIIDAQQAEVRHQYYENFPGIRAVLDANLCVLVQADDQNIRMVLSAGLILVCLVVLSIFAIVFAAILTLYRRRNWMSANTYRVHKQFILSLILQIAVPFGSIIVPISGMALCILFNVPFPKAVDSLLLVVCSSHSTLNILLMAICTRPYREATKRLLLVPIRCVIPKKWLSTTKIVPTMAKGPPTRTAAVPLRKMVQQMIPVDTPVEWRVGQQKMAAVALGKAIHPPSA